MKQEMLTQENLDKLKDELEYLKTVKMAEVAEQIKEARSFGDLSENAEYDEAKNEQGRVNSRILELEQIIKHAVVITEDMYAADEISPGCRFRVLDIEMDEEEEYHFVGTQEIDPMPVITGAMEYPEDLISKLEATGVNVDAMDCLKLANEAGSSKAVNIVLMGRVSKYFDISVEKWQKAIEECVPAKFLELNQKAFLLGRGE